MAEESESPKVWLVLLCTLAALTLQFLLCPDQFFDPFIRHDDFEVLLGESHGYYDKTLSEGRWVNWLWAARPGPFGPRVLWLMYAALWSLFCGFFGARVFPRSKVFQAVFLASTIAVVPQMANISRWFGTLVPAMALLSIYAGISAYGSPKARAYALPVLVPLGLMTHGGIPLLMVVVALAHGGWNGSRRELARFAISFCASFVGGILLIYSMNFVAHGHFGIVVAPWRNAVPPTGLVDVLSKIVPLAAWMVESLATMTHFPAVWATPPVVIGAVTLFVVNREAAERIALALVLIVGLNGAILVATGVITGFRGTYFFWPLLVMGFVHIAEAGPAFLQRTVPAVLLALLFYVGCYHTYLLGSKTADFQRESRLLAQTIQATGLAPDETVFVVGDPRQLPSGGYVVFSSLALQYRLYMTIDRPVIICFREPDACTGLPGHSQSLPTYPTPGSVVRLAEGQMVVRLPDTAANVAELSPLEPGMFL